MRRLDPAWRKPWPSALAWGIVGLGLVVLVAALSAPEHVVPVCVGLDLLAEGTSDLLTRRPAVFRALRIIGTVAWAVGAVTVTILLIGLMAS